LHNLYRLELDNNLITNLEPLYNLNKLEELSLRNNDLEISERILLEENLPEVDIEF